LLPTHSGHACAKRRKEGAQDTATEGKCRVGSSFTEQFDRLGTWRQDFAKRLYALRKWLHDQDLLDDAVHECLHRLASLVRNDKVTVAFVAEFSRGKSELINAIFFAHYGRRLMPASAGRTTMCPTELGWDESLPPCLRLLPMDTRESPESLRHWRKHPKFWLQLPLQTDNVQQIASTLAKVAEMRKVTVTKARAWGFWDESDDPADSPLVDRDGLVEVPVWRHALINMPHPLLRQGLVIVDTPGLNAVGAEPELALNLIPQAHAVVFLLAADTGVTRSDLSIWRDYLLPPVADSGTPALAALRLVVLNKIDTLWDKLSSPAQMQTQLLRQRQKTAQLLGLPAQRVLPLSAQKGLIAKIDKDAALLQASGLPALEDLLAQGILGQRQQVLHAAVSAGVQRLHGQIERILNLRRHALDEQMVELRSLRGKNASVIAAMRQRIEGEQKDFNASATRIRAIQITHSNAMRAILTHLKPSSLRRELRDLKHVLVQRGIKFGVGKVYAQTFARLLAIAAKVRAQAVQAQTALDGSFRQLNDEFGFALQAPPALDLSEIELSLQTIEDGYTRYLSLGNALRLSSAMFSQRLFKALTQRLRTVYESAINEINLWNRAVMAPLAQQTSERKRSFARRLEAITRIQSAADTLAGRIAEIEDAEEKIAIAQAQLDKAVMRLVQPVSPPPASPPPASALPAASERAQHAARALAA